MTWDSVPWFVSGGTHSAEVARQLAYAALGGAEGVIAATDCKVVPLATPGAGVQVSAGGVGILDRAPGEAEQAYTGRNPNSDTVSIAATPSSNGRSDLIVARVEDPAMAGQGYQEPSDPTVGPYIFSRVIPGVPAGTTSLQAVAGHQNDSAVALARIDIPASTGTITSGMITDLRTVARPRNERQIVPGNLGSTPQSLTMTTNYAGFPSVGIPGVVIPAWATHASVRYETTFDTVSGSPYFSMQAFLNDVLKDSTTLFSDVIIDVTAVSGGDQFRTPIILPSQGFFPVPKSLRGTTTRLVSQVKALNAAGTGAVIKTNPSDYFIADITFLERPE